MRKGIATGVLVGVALSTAAAAASAQTAAPSRDQTWGTVTTITAAAGLGFNVLMPRIFYSDPEATVGWKARWHVSSLAPVLTLTSLGLLNEYALKDSFKGYRPGCDDTNQGGPNCTSYGMMSTHSYYGFAALGQGAAVFIFDTTKWSNGRFNGGAFAGDVGVPLVLGVITAVGRGVGNYESAGQILAGGGAGLVSGFLTGMTYALMSRPECGYSGSLVCW